jgi:hypothetical protein
MIDIVEEKDVFLLAKVLKLYVLLHLRKVCKKGDNMTPKIVSAKNQKGIKKRKFSC